MHPSGMVLRAKRQGSGSDWLGFFAKRQGSFLASGAHDPMAPLADEPSSSSTLASGASESVAAYAVSSRPSVDDASSASSGVSSSMKMSL